jgi:hypothetical protein
MKGVIMIKPNGSLCLVGLDGEPLPGADLGADPGPSEEEVQAAILKHALMDEVAFVRLDARKIAADLRLKVTTFNRLVREKRLELKVEAKKKEKEERDKKRAKEQTEKDKRKAEKEQAKADREAAADLNAELSEGNRKKYENRIVWTKLWPEPISQEEMYQVYLSMRALNEKYVKYANPYDGLIATLWQIGTHGFSNDPDDIDQTIWEIYPRLIIWSRREGYGKTNQTKLNERLCLNGLRMGKVTEALALWLMDKFPLTLMLDEADVYISSGIFRSALNEGYQRGGTAGKMVPSKEDGHEGRLYDVSRGLCVSGIGDFLRSDSKSRCQTIKLEKTKEKVDHIKYLRNDYDKCAMLASKCLRFVGENAKALAGYDLDRSDRIGRNWEPLFALAHVIGNGLPELISEAAEDREGSFVLDPLEIILSHIRDAFISHNVEVIHQDHLGRLIYLANDTSWMGDTYYEDQEQVTKAVRRMLSKEGIKADQIKIKTSNKYGYRKHWFKALWERYLKESEEDAKERLKEEKEVRQREQKEQEQREAEAARRKAGDAEKKAAD